MHRFLKRPPPFLLAPFLLFLSTIAPLATASQDFYSLNGTSYPANHPFLLARGIRARNALEKRQTCTNPQGLYCPIAGRSCCTPKYSCCGADFCCPPGYACYSYTSCVLADVVTVSFFSTQWITSQLVSTVYAGTSTSWSTLGITNYETVTSHSRGGISTSTIWVTVTTTQVLKRAAAATETAPLPTNPPLPPPTPFPMQGQTPLSDIIHHALEDVGLFQKRAITLYETWFYTSTTISYSYYTVQRVVTSVTTAAVKSTLTSVIVDDATSTSTVTSTTTAAVVMKDGQLQQQGGGGEFVLPCVHRADSLTVMRHRFRVKRALRC
ncbi:hypothetical protein B0T16DRAFT_506317 [Cercophora newfieldiana]|uniref:Granulins domain-containing protein n=1 Tax=Cercophora newfieldiana TaxID=92897 RepID=A0AA39Y8S5_9PEZI|nr:hypothetical protein B0T16DRAFT_506317 [Cercophora newfieldiana]